MFLQIFEYLQKMLSTSYGRKQWVLEIHQVTVHTSTDYVRYIITHVGRGPQTKDSIESRLYARTAMALHRFWALAKNI